MGDSNYLGQDRVVSPHVQGEGQTFPPTLKSEEGQPQVLVIWPGSKGRNPLGWGSDSPWGTYEICRNSLSWGRDNLLGSL